MKKEHGKKFNSLESRKDWVLAGKICLRRRKWDDAYAHPFKISLQAFSAKHAAKIGLERLKAFARRERDEAGIRKFMLDAVSLRSGSQSLFLRGRFQNNSILFVERAGIVFE